MKNNLFFLMLFLAISCTTGRKETMDDKLKSFIKQNNHKMEDYDHVLRISETGCVGCNKSFSGLVKRYLESNNNLFILSAQGATVDISPYLDAENPENIIFDYADNFGKLNIIENSGIIYLKDNKIDSVINIEAKNIEKTLKLIDKSLN